jgi:alpha-tubulin suppressor-like RCC1 family protein
MRPSVQVRVGYNHTCALREGVASCWGRNDEANLGHGTIGGPEAPAPVFTPPLVLLEVGSTVNFGIDETGDIWSWGDGGSYGLGVSDQSPRPTPAPSPVIPAVMGIAAGVVNGCAWNVDGDVTCWGDGDAGQLALATVIDMSLPMQAMVAGVSAIALGTDHGCAIVGDHVECWGANSEGQVGRDPTTSPDLCRDINDVMVACHIAAAVVPQSEGVRAISAGNTHTCMIGSDGVARCWGDNREGQLGNGTNASSFTPQNVSNLPGPATAIAAGQYHTCALVDEAAWCWGRGLENQLGDGTTTDSLVPVRVDVAVPVYGLDTFARAKHTCAVDADDGVWCWGENDYLQLGVTVAGVVPARVAL